MPASSQGTETSSHGKTVHQASSENWNGQGGWQANRPPVQKGPEAGCLFQPLPGSQGGAHPSILLWFLTFLVRCFLQEYAYCGTASKRSDRFTEPTAWRERGGGELFCLLQIVFKARINLTAVFCGTLASNLYQESLCLHEMTIWYCIWYKTIFLLPGFTLQHIVYCTAEWFGGLSRGNRRHSPKPTWSQVNENPALNKIRQHFYTQKQLETKEIPLLV